MQDALWWSLYQAEGLLKGSWLRQKALAECMKLIHYEVHFSAYLGKSQRAEQILFDALHQSSADQQSYISLSILGAADLSRSGSSDDTPQGRLG